MISINKIYNLTLFILDKEVRGTIPPDRFNEYASLAQSSIFEDLFFQYTNWLNKHNKRLTNTGFSDLPKNLQEQIDTFSVYTTPSNFTYNGTDNLWEFTGDDFYRTINLFASFSNGKVIDVEYIKKGELYRLKAQNLISETFPVYEKIGEKFRVHPTISSPNKVEMAYVRTPKQPKWTYTVVQGNPVYNPSALDFQDCELHESQLVPMVTKILAYSGVSLREAEVTNYASNEEIKETQKKS